MFLRPKDLLRTFIIQKRTTKTDNNRGRAVPVWEDIGELVGILANASPRETMQGQQLQHPVTHTIIQQGPPKAQAGDRLKLGDRYFYIQMIPENPGDLGLYTIYLCEERQDTKGGSSDGFN